MCIRDRYNGELFEYKDKDGKDMVGIGFGTLALMQSWLERYEKYMNEVEQCKDVYKRQFYSHSQPEYNQCASVALLHPSA